MATGGATVTAAEGVTKTRTGGAAPRAPGSVLIRSSALCSQCSSVCTGRWSHEVVSPSRSGAPMAMTGTAGLGGRGRSSGARQGLKMKPSQQVQEQPNVVALQGAAPSALRGWPRPGGGLLGPPSSCMVPAVLYCPPEKGRKFFTQARGEKLLPKRKQLSRPCEVVQEDIHSLDIVQKVAQEKLQMEIYRQINKCNLLQYQVRQRSQVLDRLRRQLQQLQDAQVDENWAQLQVIRQLENNIEKMKMKVHTEQEVTSLYMAVKDTLKKELAHLPGHLDLLHGKAKLFQRELKGVELMASDALKAAKITKVRWFKAPCAPFPPSGAHEWHHVPSPEDMAKMEGKLLAAKEFRYRSLAAHKVPIDRRWLKEARERARVEKEPDVQSLSSEDELADGKMKDAESQLENKDRITEKVEKVKTVVQCSSVWDIPRGLLLQQKCSVDLDRYIQEYKAEKAAKMKMLVELEQKRDELKFHQLHSTNRSKAPEEQMKMRLQREEARLEQRRADMQKLQALLVHFEAGVDNLLARLRGIAVPGQDNSAKANSVEEKLQHCQRKLQHLVQRVASLPSDTHSTDEDMKTFVKVQQLLEKTMANHPQNKKICLEDRRSSIHDPFEFADKDDDLVLTRDYIKKQGLQLIKKKKKTHKK